MFTFKNIEDTYNINVKDFMPDNTNHTYSAKMDVYAYRKDREHYIFKLLRRHDVLINEEKPEQTSDMVMLEIGDSLYPIELSVTQEGIIMAIENFSEIKERWTDKRNELLKKYPTEAFEHYLKTSENNMKDQQDFLQILQRDPFIQFYFMSVHRDTVIFVLRHFPFHGYHVDYYGIKYKEQSIPTEKRYAVVPTSEVAHVRLTNGSLFIRQTKEGDNECVELNINLLMDDQTIYSRNILLSRDESIERTVNLWFH